MSSEQEDKKQDAPATGADPAPSPVRGGIEGNLRLLARAGLAMFVALTATLLFVQFMLGGQVRDLEVNAVERQQALGAVEASMGALFERQAEVLSSTTVEQLKPLADRGALERELRRESARLAAGVRNAALASDVERVLSVDQQLFDSIEHGHRLQATFETQLGDVQQQLRATIEQTHGILGYAHLDFVRVLRKLNVNPGNGALVREVVLGDVRAQQQLASDLVGQILTLGVLVGKIGLATSSDALNSITANEISQNIGASRNQIEQLAASVAKAPEIATRAQALRTTYEAIIPRIVAEDKPTSMISLRRAWFAQRKRAATLRATSVAAAGDLTTHMGAIQAEVVRHGERAVLGANRTIWFTRTWTFLLLTGGLGICVFAAKRIRTSVRELRESNATLRKLKEELVAINSNLEGLVAQRTLALAERERAMRLVLNNTGDGLVPVALDGSIKGEVSLAAQELFGAPAAGQMVWSYLLANDARRASAFRAAFGQLTDDILPFELCAAQVPARIERDGRIIALSCKQIREGEQFVGVLVVLRDVTAQLEAQRGEEAAREQQAVIGHILRSPQGFRAFLSECDQHIEVIFGADDLPTIKRALHTLKGSCAIFGLRSVATVCHAIEDRIADAGQLDRADADRLEAVWERALTAVKEYIERDKSRVELHSTDLVVLSTMLQERAEHQSILELVHTWSYEAVQSIFERLSAQATRIAAALGKQVEVTIDADTVRPPERLAPFWSSLIHVVRNAIDHGVESPEEREAQGKPAIGHVRLAVKRALDGALVVEIADDGRGLNFAKLAERARHMNLPHANEHELMQAVFSDGLSTRDEVTELSGRGVGLGAVRAACELTGGLLGVQSGPAGTTFSFKFPASALAVNGAGAPTARPPKPTLRA